MHSWHAYPFFRLIIPFAAGILLAIFTDLPFESSKTLLLAITLALFIPVAVTYFVSPFRFPWFSGIAVYFFLLLFGYSLTVYRTPKYDSTNISNIGFDAGIFIIRIAEPLVEKDNSFKTTGKLIATFDSANFVPTSGTILLYFEKDSSTSLLSYGDKLLVRAKITPVAPPGNPHQFDYKRFLAQSGIYHQVFIKKDEWKTSGEKMVNPLFQFAYMARHKMLNILEGMGLSGDEFSVASAILLGYDDLMDRELRNKYAGAGALHVLCVSGLHVGIIFMFLSLLFKPLERKKALRLTRVILILTGIWVYALITGLSPSVMRAGIMFSLFALRDVRKNKSNPYNILAASAFILLAIDPYMITKIGFQLSYAAVIAIISLFQPIYALLSFKNIVADYFWKLTVVSVAAQIGTFPFAVFYFHQFPVYFLITNILVIPLVWLILNTGILVLILFAISNFLAIKLSYLLYLMLFGLNGAVDFINGISGATVTGLVLTLLQVIIIYLIIIFLSRAFLLKHTGQFVYSMVCLFVLMGSFIFTKAEKLKQHEMIVYQVNGHSGIEFINGTSSFFLADSGLLCNQKLIDFNISPNRTFSGIRHLEECKIMPVNSKTEIPLNTPEHYYEPCFFLYENLKLAIVDNNLHAYSPEKPIDIDVLILRNNPDISLTELQSGFNFKKLIFDASNSFWKLAKLKEECDRSGIIYHDIKKDGYFKMDL